jgi:hypothetical protein
MAISEHEVERVVRDAKDTLEKNVRAIRESDRSVGAIQEQQQRSERLVESLNRKLESAGVRTGHAAP